MNQQLLEIINENINGSFYSLNEATQIDVADKVLDKVFVMTIGKYNKIDFSEIERTRGDIEKLKFYKNLRECLVTLVQINEVTHKIGSVEIIITALDNLIKLKSSFEKSFRIKNGSGIMIYNLVAYSIMEATSYLISTSINFATDSEIIVHDSSADALLISSLTKFNEAVSSGDIYKFIVQSEESMNDKPMNEGVTDVLTNLLHDAKDVFAKNPNGAREVFKGVKNFAGSHKVATGVAMSIAAIVLLAKIGPIIKEMAYVIYSLRHKISESAQVQAEMLELNIEVLRQQDGTAKVIAKQEKWVERFKKIAAKFALDSDKSKRDANQEMKKDKVDINSIVI